MLLCALNLFTSNSIFAQGSLAGTNIANTVSVSYNIDGNAQTPIESSPQGNSNPGVGNGHATEFLVDRKIDVIVTSNGDSNVTLGDSQAELNFTVLNEGNDSQEFALSSNNTLSADEFDTSNCHITVTAITGTPLAGVILPTSGSIKLKADQQASVSIQCDIPLQNAGQAITAGNTSLLSLLALADKNADGSAVLETTGVDTKNSIDTVFSDGVGTDDVIHDASHSARAKYIALNSNEPTPPTLSIDKAILSVQDVNGGNTAVTGSEVTYEIVISTTGTGTIDNVVITDPTPAEMSYKAGSIKLDNTAISDGADGDSGDFGVSSAETVTVNLGSITAGNQYAIQLTYIIN